MQQRVLEMLVVMQMQLEGSANSIVLSTLAAHS
jgi:hypothetical protein